MTSAILVHPDFDGIWPLAADELHRLWAEQGNVVFRRVEHHDRRPAGQIVDRPGEIIRLALLGVGLTQNCIGMFAAMRQYAMERTTTEQAIHDQLAQRGVARHTQPSEGYWSQSVAEFGLALTLCGLRRIPQNHRDMITSHQPWNYTPADGIGRPGHRGQQFGDDDRFTSGTVAGKRVRIVGAGNIGSRYASFMSMLGADVASWDPFASEPCFHRAGSRRVRKLDDLFSDAEICAPMLPLTDKTRGIVTAAHIDCLPKGCLLVLVTRAKICDMQAVRRRVLADELALAGDVFDVEPLPLDDPLLGRHNVVHSPHQAGRTRHANHQWARMLADQFDAP